MARDLFPKGFGKLNLHANFSWNAPRTRRHGLHAGEESANKWLAAFYMHVRTSRRTSQRTLNACCDADAL